MKLDATLLSGASALDAAVVRDLKGVPLIYVTHTVEWSAGVSAGVVSIEAAPSADYAGTWSVLAVVVTSAGSSVDTVVLPGSYYAIRHRISTAVIGGTVTTKVLGV